jgi:nicotinamidase-related amidase
MERGGDLLDAKRSVLVVVDLQGKLVEMVHRAPAVLANSVRLVRLAGLFRVPVVLTEQYPRGLGPTHPDVRAAFDALAVDKRRIEKTSFGCCGDRGFTQALNDLCRPRDTARQVVVAGIEAHVCVMQTVLELLDQGDQVHVCWDAVSGRGDAYRRHALERMAAAGATITNHESVGFEWARDKDHAAFKGMSALFKEGQAWE